MSRLTPSCATSRSASTRPEQRHETDSMGGIDVPADRYWGAQTQRSLVHFAIGDDRMPKRVYHAYGYVKKAAALVNAAAGRLRAMEGRRDRARRRRGDRGQARRAFSALCLADRFRHAVEHERQRGAVEPGHPAARRRRSAASRPCIRTTTSTWASRRTTPSRPRCTSPRCWNWRSTCCRTRRRLATAIEAKANEWNDVVKIGRTHLQDAVPLTVGQEWSGWAHQIRDALSAHPRVRGGSVRAGGGRDGGRHRAQCAAAFQPRDRGEDCRADRLSVRDRAQQVRRARLARRDGRGDGGGARARGRADEDRQRHALARLRPALRPRRTAACRRTSRARRSCRARSTRPSRRRW